MDNVVLIGMTGVGKSTVGVLLAKALSRDFVDTDVLIQRAEGRRLQDILNEEGLDRFLQIEERHVLALAIDNAVISTGGSVVYSEAAMAHLKRGATVVYLSLPLADLEKRVTDMDSRGIAIAPGQSFAELYRERMVLYQRYADVTVDCRGLNQDETVYRIEEALSEWCAGG